MRLSRLWGRHRDQDIYIVGTGPSMRLFPWEFFDNKLTIGLNQAYRHFTPTYMLTMHPELIPFDKGIPTQWITKIKKTEEKITKKANKLHGKAYLFENNKDIHDYSYAVKRIPPYLYIGYGIHTGAMTLAAHMKATNIILVGCDMCALDNEYHAHHQRIRLLGMPETTVYQEYYLAARNLRTVLKKYWNVNILNMNPFLGLKNVDADYIYQKKEANLNHLPEPYDESPYIRKKSKFKELNK